MVEGWQVDRSKMLQAVETLELVPARSGISSSVYMRISASKQKKNALEFAVASEVSGEIIVPGPRPWAAKPFYIDRRMFTPFIQVAKSFHSESPFEFIAEEKRLIVRQGRRKGTFSFAAETSGFGQPPELSDKDSSSVPEKFASRIGIASSMATTDSMLPQLNCVYMRRTDKGADIFASRQKLIFYARHVGDVGGLPKVVAFPLFLVPLLKVNGLQKMYWGAKDVTLKYAQGMVWQSVPSRASKEFPVDAISAQMSAGKKLPVVFQINCSVLAKSVDRLVSCLSSVRREDWTLVVTGVAGKKTVDLTVQIQQTAYRERLTLDEPLKEDVKVEWPLDMLQSTIVAKAGRGMESWECRYAYVEEKITLDSGKTRRVRRPTPCHLMTKDIHVVLPRKELK